MKNLVASTAIALALATSAYAASEVKPIATYEAAQTSQDILASEYMGMRVYATEDENFASWNAEKSANAETTQEWDDIGEINDVILSRDGNVKAVIVGVGGFIGIGERDVALPMDSIKMVREQDDADDFFLVVQASKESLEQAAEYKRPAETEQDQAEMKPEENSTDAAAKMEEKPEAESTGTASNTDKQPIEQAAEVRPAQDDAEPTNAAATDMNSETEKEPTTEQAEVKPKADEDSMQAANETGDEMKPTNETASSETDKMDKPETAAAATQEVDQTTTGSVEANRPMLRRPGVVTLEGYTEATYADLTTETLTGARVYGVNNEDVGEIDELIVDTSGQITKAVLGIGGFLGLGEHSIAVTMDEVRIMRTEDGGDVRVYIDATQEELEQQPKYEG